MSPQLASGLDYVDLQFLGHADIIATAVLHSASGVALVDPGPATSLETLRRALAGRGMAVADIRQILLTHIHLDHAGGTGMLVDENPGIEVFVHSRGARHLADPAKLIMSAGRLYGQDMERLWGDVRPVPVSRIRALEGGERILAGGRELEVAYTPGHAYHHVSYFDPSSGVAFVGDTAGIRRGSGAYVMPAAPPPDIDLDAWRASEARILAWSPDTLFLTHFGPFHGARQHFSQLMERLGEWNTLVRRLLADGTLEDDERQNLFVAEATHELRRVVGEVEAERYSRAGSLAYSWQGLARFWRKEGQQRADGHGTSIDRR
jgi:glyoxylase-like metal-dependent hydrolase (beta-lactamase superfamily II)